MTKLGPYEVHPFADDFPLIDGDEFTALVESIKHSGLRDPITLTHDRATLVDGRNRYRACLQAQQPLKFDALPEEYTEAMILDFIADKNIKRREMTPGQRAFAALSYKKRYAETTKVGRPVGDSGSRINSDGKEIPADLREFRRQHESSERAARVTGASGRGVQQAQAIERDTPDLAVRVRRGELALDAAYKQRKQRVRSQPKPEPAPKPSQVMLTLRTHKGDEIQYPKPQSKPSFNETTGEGISWAAWSWNPVTGCLHGCVYCYAREIATSERYKASYPVGFTPLLHHERLDAPANTTIPARYRDDDHPPCNRGDCKTCEYRRVFVCSMADLYGRWVPDEWIEQVHASMLDAPHWEYLLLTKFPSRYIGLDLPPNAWLGTSVDEQKRVRIAEDAFRKVDGVKFKWLSLEPLREPLEFTDLSMFDWIVIGAQTETHQPSGLVPALGPEADWVYRIYHQAREAGCKVHMKPNLVNGRPGMRPTNEYPELPDG